MIEIEYSSNKMKRVCTDAAYAVKQYGREMALKIHQRIDQISSAVSVEMLVQYKVGRCHALKGNLKGKYAMDLGEPYRLIFQKIDNCTVKVEILEIVDYH